MFSIEGVWVGWSDYINPLLPPPPTPPTKKSNGMDHNTITLLYCQQHTSASVSNAFGGATLTF